MTLLELKRYTMPSPTPSHHRASNFSTFPASSDLRKQLQACPQFLEIFPALVTCFQFPSGFIISIWLVKRGYH